MELLYDFYKNILGVKNEETIAYLVDNSKYITFKKHTTLYRTGEMIDKFNFFYSGLLYVFRYKNKNRKDMCYLYTKAGTPISTDTEVHPHLSDAEIYFPVDSSIIQVDYEVIQNVIEKDPYIMTIYANILKEILEYKNDFIYMRHLPPLERVKTFFERFSDTAKLMSNTDIAAYLDMSRSEFIKALKQI